MAKRTIAPSGLGHRSLWQLFGCGVREQRHIMQVLVQGKSLGQLKHFVLQAHDLSVSCCAHQFVFMIWKSSPIKFWALPCRAKNLSE